MKTETMTCAACAREQGVTYHLEHGVDWPSREDCSCGGPLGEEELSVVERRLEIIDFVGHAGGAMPVATTSDESAEDYFDDGDLAFVVDAGFAELVGEIGGVDLVRLTDWGRRIADRRRANGDSLAT